MGWGSIPPKKLIANEVCSAELAIIRAQCMTRLAGIIIVEQSLVYQKCCSLLVGYGVTY